MSQRGEYRPIHKALIYGRDFQRLPASAQLVFIALKVNIGPSGIDRFPGMLDALTECTPFDRGAISQALAALESFKDADTGEADPWVKRDGNVVWIVRGLEYEPSLDQGNKLHRKGLANHVRGLPRIALVAEFVKRYRKWFDAPESLCKGYPKAIDTHAIAIPNTDTETETETETETKGSLTAGAVKPANGSHPPTHNSLLLPKPVVDRLYGVWVKRRGAVSYPRFRKALLPLFTGPAPPFTEAQEAQIANAIDANAEIADGATVKERSFMTVESFAADIHNWVRLGAMPRVQDGEPTERLMLATGTRR